MSFSQVAQFRLAVVLLEILVCLRLFVEKLVQYHTGIYAGGAPEAAPAGAAGIGAPGVAPGVPGAAGSIPAMS